MSGYLRALPLSPNLLIQVSYPSSIDQSCIAGSGGASKLVPRARTGVEFIFADSYLGQGFQMLPPVAVDALAHPNIRQLVKFKRGKSGP